MAALMLPKLAAAGFAALTAVGASLVSSAKVDPAPAFGAPATSLEAGAAARHAAAAFSRADLNNDGALDADEFSMLAIVTAELSRLNGFVAVDFNGGVRTVATPKGDPSLSKAERARIEARAARAFGATAGEDQRLSGDEFVTAQLETFMARDADRNGLLTDDELAAYALAQSHAATPTS